MTERDYRIDISSKGGEITLSPESALRLLVGGLSGLDSTDFDVVTEAYANDNGGYVKRRRFAERDIGLTFEITENDGLWRRQILAVVHPLADCEITVHMDGVTRRITAIPVERVTFRRDSFYDRSVVTLRFTAPDPFLMAEKASGGTFVRKLPLLTFPMTFYPHGRLTAGYAAHTDSGNAFNAGDVACGVVITIKAQGGDVVNPRISCGEHTISTTVTLTEGDEMVMDTRTRRKGIRLNGQNRLVFDWKSTFFSLEAGDNVLTADADEGKENMAVTYEYTPLYVGM